MRVLWICNKMLPRIGDKLNINTGNKEGWLNTLSDNLLKKAKQDIEDGLSKKDALVLGVAFPTGKDLAAYHENVDGLEAFGFFEDTAHPENYDSKMEDRFRNIFATFKPDIIHIFGTEFPHTLAATKAFRNPTHTLIGIQGICSECANAYKDGIGEKDAKRYTLRDFLKKDNIEMQYQKFVKRGSYERQALKLAGHIAGRTEWDKANAGKINPDAAYHTINETLRTCFYEGAWDYDKCDRHSIFISQADYTIKGFHIFLEALPRIIEEYPDVAVKVSGNCILDTNGSADGETYKNSKKNIKKSILISSYGSLLRKQINNHNLGSYISFLGSISAESVKEEMLRANLYCLPSLLENSSNSMGEAMLLGLPVVASRVGGTPSMIKDEEEAILYDSLDAAALADAIIKVFKAYDTPSETWTAQVRRMPVLAKKHASDSHNPDKNLQELLSIYEEIL